MAKEKVALYLLYEFEEVFMELDSDEERGQLIMAIYNYERRGIEPEFKGTLKFAWRTHIKPKIDQITANYQRKCDVNVSENLGLEIFTLTVRQCSLFGGLILFYNTVPAAASMR